jgi:hypothetical protein
MTRRSKGACLIWDAVFQKKTDRSPQALQRRVETEVARWSSVLKGARAVAN